MSLLRQCVPRLRLTPRPCFSVLYSNEAAPPLPPLTLSSSTRSADQQSLIAESLAAARVPISTTTPIGGVYPRENQNPLRAQRQSNAVNLTRVKPLYSIYVKATRTNTITTLTRPNGNPIRTLTGGKVGFKGGNRSSYEAGYKCAVEIFQTLQQQMEIEDLQWQLFMNGFGQGREAMQKALLAEEGSGIKPALVRITDKTPIKIGGTRAQKMKRR